MSRHHRVVHESVGLKLTRAELWELSARLEQLYGARSFRELLESSVALIRPFFDADFYSAGITDPNRCRHVAIRRPSSPSFFGCAEHYRNLAAQSPLLQYWLGTGDHDRVLRRSDCCDLAEYRRTELYNEVDRFIHGNQLIGTWLRPGGGRHLEIAMGRSGRTDFSKCDVARLTFLRRHVFSAYRNVCELQQIASIRGSSPADDLPGDAVELQDTSLAAGIDLAGSRAMTPALSGRERDVLHWIIQGKTNREIGIILDISWRTVRLHCERIFQKLNVETRTAAAMRGLEAGLDC